MTLPHFAFFERDNDHSSRNGKYITRNAFHFKLLHPDLLEITEEEGGRGTYSNIKYQIKKQIFHFDF